MKRQGRYTPGTLRKMSEAAKRRCDPPILSKEDLAHLCLKENKSDLKIGIQHGVRDHVIRHLRRIYDISPTRRLLAIRNREGRLGKKASIQTREKMSADRRGEKNPNWGKPKSERTKAKLRAANLGKNNPAWRGGKHIDAGGYVRVFSRSHPRRDRDGYVFEHRLIVEKMIGRYLGLGEKCHHLNKNKTDNRPENLIAFGSHGAHLRFERNCPIVPKDIIFDGRSLQAKPS